MPRLLIALVLGVALFAACRAQLRPAAGGGAVIAQWSGPFDGALAGNRVLRTPAEWEAFWRQVKRETPRPLDVAHEMAVVIQLGERRTAGFEARVLSVTSENRTLLVTYEEITPAPGAISAQVLTSPWVVAIVPRTDLPVEFRRVTATPKSER